MKRTLLVTLALLGTTGALIAIAAWEPWVSREREHELAWLEAFDAWSDRIDAGLEGGDLYAAANCAESYSAELGRPPTELAGAGRIARAACGRLSLWVTTRLAEPHGWGDVRRRILADVTERRARDAEPVPAPELAEHLEPLAGSRPDVFCWPESHWDELNEDSRLIRLDELWLLGFADTEAGTIHLAPEVCDPSHRFFSSNYAPNLNEESLDLAIALVTLAHEAEHLRSPLASEAAVECVALQRIRDLVRAAGRGKPYEDLMAGLAWDVGYPNMPEEYRTAQCADGSGLDVRPETNIFP